MVGERLGTFRLLTPEGIDAETFDPSPMAALTPKPLTPRRTKPPQADVMWLFDAPNTTLVLLTMTFATSLSSNEHSLTYQLSPS